MTDESVPDGRVLFQDIKPYEAPTRLDELHGPFHGVVELPITVYWGPPHVFDVDRDADLVMAYQAVLREGRVVDQVAILHPELLLAAWPRLLLPVRVRRLWEQRFPELAAQ